MNSPAWMDTLATDLRIGGRIVQETLCGLKRTGWMNVVIILTLGAILSIFGTFSAALLETQLLMDNLGSGLKISVYTSPSVELSTMVTRVKALPHVKGVDIETRESAWATMRQEYDVPNIANPLPDTIHVQMDDQRFIEPTVQRLGTMPGVEKVQYAQRLLTQLQKLAKTFSAVGVAIAVILGGLTLIVISNTIHLLIEARSREIEILRMMGIGNGYIQMPFLLQGATYGLLGTLLAAIPLATAEHYIATIFNYFQFSTSGVTQAVVFWAMATLGVLVGSGGAAISVRKYLHI